MMVIRALQLWRSDRHIEKVAARIGEVRTTDKRTGAPLRGTAVDFHETVFSYDNPDVPGGVHVMAPSAAGLRMTPEDYGAAVARRLRERP